VSPDRSNFPDLDAGTAAGPKRMPMTIRLWQVEKQGNLRASNYAEQTMAFTPIELKVEAGAKRIGSADDAYGFMMYMQLSYRNGPHWQVAKQAFNNAMMSEESEIQAWRTFRTAARAEGRLQE
jgi:hypothetical protein